MPPRKPVKAPPIRKSTSETADKKTKIKLSAQAELKEALQGGSGKGDGTVEVLVASNEHVFGFVRNVLPTGSAAIDRALGLGGIPGGRIIEISGKPDVGKTTFVDHLIVQVQKRNGVAGVVDSENKRDAKYSALIGVDNSKLLLVQPTAGVQTIEFGIDMMGRAMQRWVDQRRTEPLLFAWDSIAGSPTDEELSNAESAQPGIPARALRRAMRRLNGLIARAGAYVILVNQTYEVIGMTGFGAKSKTYGGGGIRYHSTARIELVRTGQLKGAGGEVVGMEGEARVFKNSLGSTRTEPFAVQNYVGVVDAWSILEKLKDPTTGPYITAAGGWYCFSAQGQEPLRWQGGWRVLAEMMKTNPVLHDQLHAIYRAIP